LISLPTSRQHITIIGRNGSGKTVAAMWHLSNANFLTQPWIILDYKRDENLNAIEGVEYVDWKKIPKYPGIYILNPLPNEKEEMDEYLTRVWEREKIGLLADEGFMLNGIPAFETNLMQGRSKQIPMIVLTQRPSWITRFAFSESRYYQVFQMNDARDRKTIGEFIPGYRDLAPLPAYHSHYYDVDKNKLHVLGPVPDVETIQANIEERLDSRRRKKTTRYL